MFPIYILDISLYKVYSLYTLAIVHAVCVDNQFTQRLRYVANRGCTMHAAPTRAHAATGCTGILRLVI